MTTEAQRAEKRAERARKYPVSGGVSTRVEPREVNVISGTFVHEQAVAERMLEGARRHLNSMPKVQAEARIRGMRFTGNTLRGAIRRSIRKEHREKSKGSEGFQQSAILTFRGAGPSQKAQARQRAREFNATHGVEGNG